MHAPPNLVPPAPPPRPPARSRRLPLAVALAAIGLLLAMCACATERLVRPGGLRGAGVGGASATRPVPASGAQVALPGGPASAGGEVREAPTPFATDGIHVAVTGNDRTGNGSASAPYRSVQHALDHAAKPNGVVLVHAGTYVERVRIRHAGLVLQAAKGERAHLSCPVSMDEQNPPICVEIDAETKGVTLRGLEISGGFYAVYLGSHWDYDDTPLDNPAARGVVIEDCVIHDSGRDAVKLPAGCDDVTIRRCEIYGSGRGYGPRVAPEDKNAEGIDAVNADNLRVADTYIHDTATTCLYVKGGSIGTVIERVRVERCGELGIALGFDTSPEFFDLKANPRYFENIGGVVRNSLVRDTGLAGIGLFASRDARVLHNTVVGTAKRGMAALYLGVATQDYDPKAGRPPNTNPTIVGNVIDQRGVPSPRCFGIRHSVEGQLGALSGLTGVLTSNNNLYHAGPAPCLFDDNRPGSLLDGGSLAAWQAHAPGFDAGSRLVDPRLDTAGRPLAGSPAIDALRTPTPGVGLDLDGQIRKVPYDLGADER